MAWNEKNLGAFGRVRECLPEYYPSSFGLKALFASSERRPPLRAPGAPGEPRALLSMIGPDNRERRTDTELPPLSMICSITATDAVSVSNGTGWLVSPRVVVTAAHVLWDRNENFQAISAVIRPGREVGKQPFGSFTVHETDWKLAADYDGAGPAGSDLAVIRLGSEPTPSPGFFGMGAFSDAALADRLVTIGGYPKWVGETNNIIPDEERYLRMYIHRDRILSLRPGQIFYDVDTFKGQSGAPVVMMPRQDDPFSGPVVVGIHTRGQDPEQTAELRNNNSATRITAPVMDFIRNFVEETIVCFAVMVLLAAGLVVGGGSQRAWAADEFPAGVVPAAIPITIVDLWKGNTISLPLTGLVDRDLPLSASVQVITRRLNNADVRVSLHPVLESDCSGQRQAAQLVTLAKGQSCQLFITLPGLGPGTYGASVQFATGLDARQISSIEFKARYHWVVLAAPILVGILTGGFLVWWRDRQGPIARSGLRVIRLHGRLSQLSSQAVPGATAILAKVEAARRKLESGETVEDADIDDFGARLSVIEEIVQVRRLAAGVPNNQEVMTLTRTTLGNVPEATLPELKASLNDIHNKLNELRAGGGPEAAQIRESAIDVPLPVGLPPNITEGQLRRGIGLWDFVTFACLAAIFIAIAILSIWIADLAWGDFQDILGAFLIGVASVGGMDVTLQALRKTLPL